MQYEQLKVKCNLLGYLNDTTWIASSKAELEEMLHIADSFYTFMNIKVNKQKFILMTNNINHISNGQVTLHFRSDHITLPNTPQDQSIRFLDVWINLQGSHHFNIHKACQITASTSLKLACKKLSGDHVKYVTNKVVISQLDFLLQCTILSKRNYTKLIAPLCKMFKYKAHLCSTTSNNIIHSQFPYELLDFEQHHTINMLLSLHKQFNNPSILGQLAYMTLSYLQLKY